LFFRHRGLWESPSFTKLTFANSAAVENLLKGKKHGAENRKRTVLGGKSNPAPGATKLCRLDQKRKSESLDV
jgi:hypothetical protein